MDTETIRVRLDAQEYHALARLSERELRAIADQARVVIREDLRQRGLLRREAGNARP